MVSYNRPRAPRVPGCCSPSTPQEAPMTLLTLPDAGSSGLSERAKALVFEDPRSVTLLKQVRGVAGRDAPVLLSGETGTGRELLARYIHELSLRRLGPFLA